MKSILSILIVAIAALSGVVKTDALPCDRGVFNALCNPKLKIVESCYDCERIDNGKERCFPAFKKFDITDFLSTKKWTCEQHEWQNPFHPEEGTVGTVGTESSVETDTY
jgi:hypothetical protein